MREGGCACGAVRFAAEGEPMRVGLCHRLTCRRETGSVFNAFGVWPEARATVTGATASWSATGGYARHFCPRCGSSVFGRDAADPGEVELRLGAFDAAPGDLVPGYELWVGRRETWLAPVAPAQFSGNRPG